jgi:outer membrane protein assembly factor BamD (BamD/ComL family)
MHPRSILVGLIVLGGLVPVAMAAERTVFPPSARQRYERGLELLQKGRYREAAEAFDEAMRQGMKDFPRVHLGLARSALLLKDYDAAIQRYTGFIEQFGLEASCRH